MNEAGYYQHRDFSQEHIRNVRTFYLSFFHDAERVLELGCGRGEFLELLRDHGKKVQGVELDAEMAQAAREKGIDVAVSPAADYLRGSAGEPVDAIVAAHLLEHLSVNEADELIGLAVGHLCRGGILCLIVPNTASYPVLAEEFWNDPTHVRPYGRELLAYLVAKHHLRILKQGVNPTDIGGYPIDLASIAQGSSSPLRRFAPPEMGHLRHLLKVFEGHHELAQKADVPAPVKELWQAMVYVVKGLTEELKDSHQRIAELNETVLYLNHQLSVMGGNLRRLVEILYAPNEYFIVGQKS